MIPWDPVLEFCPGTPSSVAFSHRVLQVQGPNGQTGPVPVVD